MGTLNPMGYENVGAHVPNTYHPSYMAIHADGSVGTMYEGTGWGAADTSKKGKKKKTKKSKAKKAKKVAEEGRGVEGVKGWDMEDAEGWGSEGVGGGW